MKKSRAAISLLTAAAISASVLLSGCSGDSGKDGVTTVTMLQYKPEAVKAFEKIEKLFNETHDDIQLKIESPNEAIFTYIIPTIGSALHINFLENSILAGEETAWIGVLIVGVWQAVAMNTIIYISGLQTIPTDIYEAGMIDGVTPWQKFRHLTLPMLMPFVTTNLVLSTKNMLMVFDQIMALTKGGPAQSTESISYLIYKNGMDGGQFGFQSANAVVFFIVIVAISIFQMVITNKKEEQL